MGQLQGPLARRQQEQEQQLVQAAPPWLRNATGLELSWTSSQWVVLKKCRLTGCCLAPL